MTVPSCATVSRRSLRRASPGLAVKYHALLWQLIKDDVILDRTLRRRAVACGKELDALAKQDA